MSYDNNGDRTAAHSQFPGREHLGPGPRELFENPSRDNNYREVEMGAIARRSIGVISVRRSPGREQQAFSVSGDSPAG